MGSIATSWVKYTPWMVVVVVQVRRVTAWTGAFDSRDKKEGNRFKISLNVKLMKLHGLSGCSDDGEGKAQFVKNELRFLG